MTMRRPEDSSPDERTHEQSRVFEEEILPQIDAVYSFALHLSKDRDLADDLTQETFLRAFKNIGGYTPGSRPKSWLFTICRNLFLRRRERSARHREIVSEVAEKDPRQLSRENTVFMEVRNRDPEGEFWKGIVDDEVLNAIERLPHEFREAVVLSDIEDLPYDEVAEVLGVPVGTVKSRLFRGRKLLQKKLYDYASEQGIIPREGADGA